jgi:hypothetical protein
VLDSLQLTAGLTHDWMKYPANFQTTPISAAELASSRLSPKAGLIWNPMADTIVRFAYTRSTGGASVEQSSQLEPPQVAGFVQSFRDLIPESVVAQAPAEQFETYGFSLEQQIGGGTYLGFSADILNSRIHQVVGSFDELPDTQKYAVASSLREDYTFHEKTLRVTANQLLGREWSVGSQYSISQATLYYNFVDVPDNQVLFTDFRPRQWTQAILQQASVFANFNHSSGFFLSGEAVWNAQNNQGYMPYLPGDDFWQFNAYAGWRFFHRKAEIRLGLLNIGGQDYNLNPLSLHPEYPHARTATMRLRLNF